MTLSELLRSIWLRWANISTKNTSHLSPVNLTLTCWPQLPVTGLNYPLHLNATTLSYVM